jgi:hypothetical protein
MQTGRASPVIPAVSPPGNVQFSRFTETEVAKILTFGSDGLLEVMVPMTDDERRDLETHLKQKFRLSLAIQVKARHVLVRRNRADLLEIRLDEKRERLVADLFFWYFFGFMDVTEMHFRAPVFLVPSDVVHTSADPRGGCRPGREVPASPRGPQIGRHEWRRRFDDCPAGDDSGGAGGLKPLPS